MENQGSGMSEVGQLVHYIVNEVAALKAAQQEFANVAINSRQILEAYFRHVMSEFHVLKDAMTDFNNKLATGNKENMGTSVFEALRNEKDLLASEAGRQNAKYEAKVNEMANIQAELMQSRLNLKQQAEESERRAKTLHEAENTKKRLTEELDASHEQYRILASRYRELELQSQTYREESIKCRNILTKESGGCEEIDDREVVRTYRAIRSQIQDIVHDFFFEQASIPTSHKLSALHNKLFDPLRTVSGSTQRIHRLRGLLFQLVDEWILSKQCLALESFEEKAEKGQFEKGLGIFEQKLLELDPAQKQDINKWRARTVIYASLLCIPQSLADETAGRIYDVLKLLLPSTTSKEIEQQVLTRLNQLCKDAFEFTRRHRRTQDQYRCVSPEKGTILNESIAKPQGTEACSELEAAQHDQIALVLSPALVKYPLLEEMLVLEKAHVVVYRD